MERLKKLGYNLDEKDIPFPEEREVALGLAILVDYKTSIDEQCQKLGIKSWLGSLRHGDLYSGNTSGRWGWIYQITPRVGGGGLINSNTGIRADAVYCYCGTYRDLMTVEGIALYRENPDFFKNRIVDFLGSTCQVGGLGYNPSFCWNDGKPELDSNYVEKAI